MQPEQSKPSKQATEEGNDRLRQMSAHEGNEIEVTAGTIWVSHASTPENNLNLKEFIAELAQGGITVEAKSFYCG